VADERELATRIRSGDLPADDRHLLDAVRQTVVDKVLVANPRYLAG
jgi:hypothetical protein